MRKSLEEELRLYQVRAMILECGLERHRDHPILRMVYESEFLDLIGEGRKYPSHVWKPLVHWYVRYQEW